MFIFHDLDLLFDEEDCICPDCEESAIGGHFAMGHLWHDDCWRRFQQEYDQHLFSTEPSGEIICTSTRPEDREEESPF